MGVSLSKGGNVSLSKAAPAMTAAMVGLGWDERATSGVDFDLDAVVFLLGANGRVRNDQDFIFYNNLSGANGAVVHQGDNLTGAGDGDDESVLLNLPNIPADVEKIMVCVTIHDAHINGLTFGQVANAFVRVIDAGANTEVARYDLGEDAGTETALIFSEIYRHGTEWKMRAVGQGFAGGLGPLAASYGVNVGS